MRYIIEIIEGRPVRRSRRGLHVIDFVDYLRSFDLSQETTFRHKEEEGYVTHIKTLHDVLEEVREDTYAYSAWDSPTADIHPRTGYTLFRGLETTKLYADLFPVHPERIKGDILSYHIEIFNPK